MAAVLALPGMRACQYGREGAIRLKQAVGIGCPVDSGDYPNGVS
jgi:hypothetical protein